KKTCDVLANDPKYDMYETMNQIALMYPIHRRIMLKKLMKGKSPAVLIANNEEISKYKVKRFNSPTPKRYRKIAGPTSLSPR
ncbi:unnamed protein product, partial [Dovyalis caffra]